MYQPTRESLRSLADDASFVRGLGYLAEGRVYDALLADDRLTGRCTCPRGDFCKHLVALGLLSIEKPREVTRIDRVALAGRLRERDPEELVELIVDRAVDEPAFARRVLELFDARDDGSGPTGIAVEFPSLVAHYREIANQVTPGWSSNPYRAGHQYASGVLELLMRGAREAASDPVRLLGFYTGVYQAIERAIGQLDDSDGVVGGQPRSA